MIFLIIPCLLLITGIIVFFVLRNKKYVEYIKNNSLALEELLIINKKFNFYNNIYDDNESNTYDNENFFDIISCEDYLIYQLQYKKYDIEKKIKNIFYNKKTYEKYCNKISQINNFGVYKNTDEKLNKKYLSKIEQKIFNKNKLKPKTNFYIYVTLYLSKINGDVYDEKSQCFSDEEVELLIKRLNNKYRGFYNDREIWDALCRVERGKVTNKIRFAIYDRDGYRCCICGRGESQDYLEIDHIKPISKGGKSTIDNLQTLCRRCNKNKGNNY